MFSLLSSLDTQYCGNTVVDLDIGIDGMADLMSWQSWRPQRWAAIEAVSPIFMGHGCARHDAMLP